MWMMMLFKEPLRIGKLWWRNQSGVAATEFALAFPILFMMLLATIELGNGIMANQKTIAASQMIADLITRTDVLTNAQLTDVKNAGRLALAPFDQDDVGFDILSVRFDPDGSDSGTEPDPVIVWRDTDNMDGNEYESDFILDNAMPLALTGDGLIIVYVRFPYTPAFGTRFVGDINMIEASFARGRKSPVVTRSGS